MAFPERGRSEWAGLLSGPILAIVSFVLTYYIDPLNFGDREPLAAVPALLLAIVILLVSHTLAAQHEIRRTSAMSDRIYEAVKDYLHVTKIGSPEAALSYVHARLPILQDVRNTSFNMADGVDRSDERLYETQAYANLNRSVAEWSSKGLRWKDVGDPRAASRLRDLASLSHETRGRRQCTYQYRLLGRDEPQVNFILLGYPDGSTEALFNWDFRNIGQDPVVLLSRDRDIVEMFAVQFELLWRASSPDHDSSAVKSTSKK